MQSRDCEDTRWFLADTDEPKAVAAVVHGLNLRPSKMGDIVESLRAAEVDVLRVALTGHRGREGEISTVTRNIWLNDMADAYRKVLDRAQYFGIPKHFVGYSLGGLLQIDLMQEQPQMRYDRMAFFAPALSLCRKVYCLKALTALMPRSWKIPSLNPRPDFFANKGLPAAAYHALFNSHASVQRTGIPQTAGEIPTEVFIHPQDELVSAKGLESIVDACPSWSMEPVQRVCDAVRYGVFHLIIDAEALGNTEWERVTLSMTNHLLD